MITPRFTITQSDSALTVTIYAPFTNVADTEVFMEERDFRFFSKPYFLRLHLPGEVHETDAAAAKYDADTRSFVVTVPKKNKGEVFRGLDMLTELLRPRDDGGAAAAGIEEVGGGYSAPGEEDEEEIDWYFEQQIPEGEDEKSKLGAGGGDGYGFAFAQSGVFSRLREEAAEILDVKNPDELTAAQRREVRTEMESACFDPDHYLCDLFESDEVLRLAGNKSLWRKVLDREVAEEAAFSDKDRERMMALPKRVPLVEKADLNSVYFGLVDILFGCCYDARVNEGERCAESAWNVAKLSPTLSCCERHASLRECVAASVRRSLCFPLYRHFGLALAVLGDVAAVLRLGRAAVVGQLLEAAALMADEGRHVLNQLYLEPYAAWAQRVDERRLQSLAEAVEAEAGRLTRADLDLELEETEEAARLTLAEEEEAEVARKLQGMDLGRRVADGDSDDDTSSSSGSSSTGSSCSSDSSDDDDVEKEGAENEKAKECRQDEKDASVHKTPAKA